jgi:hypothetical protein
MAASLAVSAFEQFLAGEISQAVQNPAYVGTTQHLQSLGTFAEGRCPGIQVVWGPASFWEPGRVVVMKPAGFAPEEAAELVALVVLHETLHEKHSRPPGSKQVYIDLRGFESTNPTVDGLPIAFLNLLEDDRISRLEAGEDPEMAKYLDAFADDVVVQYESAYETKHQASPWTTQPVSANDQLLVSLVERIFARGRSSAVKPTLMAALAEFGPIIDCGVTGTFFDAGGAACDLAEAYAKHNTAV